MGDFRDTTKTIHGHHGVSAVRPGPVQPTFGRDFRNLTEREPSHNFSGSSAVRRQVPTTEEEADHGGRSDLLPGYAKGGKHFHVHKHYYTGGKVKTVSSHYTGGRVAKKTGGTVNRFGEGGSCTGETRNKVATGGTQNKMKKGGKWISKAIKHPGALHRSLGVPEGKKIPASKLAKAAHSSNPTTRRRANLAKTLKGFHKARGGPITKTGVPPSAGAGRIHKGWAKGGWMGGAGGIHDNTDTRPAAGRPRLGGMATGGTINKYGAGGALYKAGGRSAHEESREHGGFRSELSNLRSKLED